jgi:hypothetical protein
MSTITGLPAHPARPKSAIIMSFFTVSSLTDKARWIGRSILPAGAEAPGGRWVVGERRHGQASDGLVHLWVKTFTKALAPPMPSNRYQTGAYARAANDFYPTPSWVTELLTNTVRLRGTVWEPCAGKGALATVLAEAGYRVLASDLVAYGDCVFPVAAGVDALQAPLPAGVRAIVTNPPYDKFLLPELVRHWLGLLRRPAGAAAEGALGRE